METLLENHLNCCRCCSLLLQASHKTVRISKSIEKRYFELSGVKLIMSEDYSSIICESCNSKLSEFSDFRSEICEYQNKLYTFVAQKQTSNEDEDQLIVEELSEEPDNLLRLKMESPEYHIMTYEEHPAEEQQFIVKLPETKPSFDKFCSECNKFFSARSFYYHTMRKHSPNQFTCDIDGRSFSVKQDLREHMKIHVQERQKLYCKTCSASFLSSSALKHHENFFHSDYIEEHPCEVCSKIFASRMKLLQHISNVHKDGTFKCPQCERAYQTPASLKKHLNMHNKNKEPCAVCQKLIASGLAMNIHLKSHDKPAIKCEFEGCDREFRNKRALNDHMESHMHPDPVLCPECNASFSTSRNLQRHQKRMHTTEKAYCEVEGCHHAATRKDYLMKHYAAHREIPPETRQFLVERVKCMKNIPW